MERCLADSDRSVPYISASTIDDKLPGVIHTEFPKEAIAVDLKRFIPEFHD
ncbi:predicted protein [Botrytis cinerea T4]|uniref:Uncharacterized protein n=1 Tax=Botryotinia fuckeliana (strain T4) TaxID=999810 RepID=G2XRA4_BOTF4|nr:predicted protein [Botrytis cinerea T4]